MIAECQYGGRVTDEFDKRLLGTFTSRWFGETMFDAAFSFVGTSSGGGSGSAATSLRKAYAMPKYGRVDELLAHVGQLPASDRPEVFGLHANANITYQTNTAKHVLDTILGIQPKEANGLVGETRESVVARLAKDMLDKLPVDFVAHEVRARLATGGSGSGSGSNDPMKIFLRQEIDRMQRVIGTVRRTLLDLKLAIDGTIIMNEELRNALDFIYDAKIPAAWQRISWESSTLGFWFTELIERNGQLRRWCFETKPLCFWLTGFFNAQGFLTAMKQEVTRANKDKGWALDTVALTNDVLNKNKDDVTQPPNAGVYVYGLFLEGAAWSRTHMRLVESRAKVLFDPMPVIHISAVATAQPDQPQLLNAAGGASAKSTSNMASASASAPATATPATANAAAVASSSTTLSSIFNYACPIYKKPKRTDLMFITTINLRTNVSPDTWTLRGTCLLCDTK